MREISTVKYLRANFLEVKGVILNLSVQYQEYIDGSKFYYCVCLKKNMVSTEQFHLSINKLPCIAMILWLVTSMLKVGCFTGEVLSISESAIW